MRLPGFDQCLENPGIVLGPIEEIAEILRRADPGENLGEARLNLGRQVGLREHVPCDRRRFGAAMGFQGESEMLRLVELEPAFLYRGEPVVSQGMNGLGKRVSDEAIGSRIERAEGVFQGFGIGKTGPVYHRLKHFPRRSQPRNIGRWQVFLGWIGPGQRSHANRKRREVLRQLPVLRRQPPDPAVLFVAVGMTKRRLVVADDRVEPIGDVDRAVGTDPDFDRPETFMARHQQFDRFDPGVPGTVFHEREGGDPMRVVAGDEDVMLEPVRQVRGLDVFARHRLAGRDPDAGHGNEIERMRGRDEAGRRVDQFAVVRFHEHRA